ncbi:molybdate ABC transporter permease subunit [Simiduia agarivorans]|uniref:Molybdenum transport system permease n=1 Tax=Simiduia agarivorans (strain DSM 21679 / JCM 13881 / BCRC 17597 / SA1) TaxID=1117647 RepID=K4KP55_SIMAS|nr:molybdate ABC transporter permease subunit [Simiduia agarivorans]AFV00021.1 molybdate ABC transporter inner membrane subunit [Simiduia agarivorans SA1 = DSM 21679]
MIDAAALAAIVLSLKLAAVSTTLLLLLAIPLAWWLQASTSALARASEILVALPLVLPPTVIGFYLLLAFSPHQWPGAQWLALTGSSLAFSFTGLVIGSMVYSLPFVVQPLQASFAQLDKGLLEMAELQGLNRWQQFAQVVLPLCKQGFAGAFVLGFAHTLGEFGVVLMIGGNIPDETRVASIAIFDAVEQLDYAAAHQLSLIMLAIAVVALLAIYGRKKS